MRRAHRLALFIVVALVVASCGGDGDATPSTAPPTTADGGGTAATTAATTVAPTEAPPGTSAPTGDPVERCEGLYGVDEAAALFGEAAVLDEATANASLGQLICSWSTVEDPGDLEDLTSETILFQFYSGSPIAGDNFYDESLYPGAIPVDGIGDKAFMAYTVGTADGAFVDGDAAGFLSYFVVDLGNTGESADVTEDDAVALLRTFHDRAV